MQQRTASPTTTGPAKVIGYTLDAYGFRTTILDRPAAQVDDTDHGLRPDQIAACGLHETDHCDCTQESPMSRIDTDVAKFDTAQAYDRGDITLLVAVRDLMRVDPLLDVRDARTELAAMVAGLHGAGSVPA